MPFFYVHRDHVTGEVRAKDVEWQPGPGWFKVEAASLEEALTFDFARFREAFPCSSPAGILGPIVTEAPGGTPMPSPSATNQVSRSAGASEARLRGRSPGGDGRSDLDSDAGRVTSAGIGAGAATSASDHL